MELQICHVGDQNGAPLFSVVRSGDLKRTARSPFRRRSPFRWGRRGSGASSEASLVPEGYLQAPFGAYRQSAQAVAETLQAWGGRSLTGSSWARPRAGIRLPEGKASGTSGLRSPAIRRRSWPGPGRPCTAGEDGYLALRFPVERQLSTALGDPPPLPESLPQDALRILYVIPRPDGTGNVGYRTLAKSLVGCIEEENLPVTVDVLRPPTFDRLRQVLGERPGYYHIVHFDGHGSYGDSAPGAGCYAAAEGRLAFEDEKGRLEAIETTRLAQLLAQCRIPCMVLNACQSGMMDGQAWDPFACVAAGLLRAGVYSVVAMGLQPVCERRQGVRSGVLPEAV